ECLHAHPAVRQRAQPVRPAHRQIPGDPAPAQRDFRAHVRGADGRADRLPFRQQHSGPAPGGRSQGPHQRGGARGGVPQPLHPRRHRLHRRIRPAAVHAAASCLAPGRRLGVLLAHRAGRGTGESAASAGAGPDPRHHRHALNGANPMSSFLKTARDGAVLTLTMSQPETRNALTGNTAVEEFVQACADIAADRTVRAVILTGEGPVFSSGGNVKSMQRYYQEQLSPETIREEYRNGIQRLPKALYNLDVPLIAAVNGPAIGAGMDLTCMCDIRIASEKATFAESFVKVGIVPGDGGAWLLPRVVGMSKASEMAFTGEALTAQEALACGLVSRVVPHESLMETAMTLARKIAANPGGVLRMTKRLLREGERATLDSLLEISAAFQAIAHMEPDHHEAVRAFVEKRAPKFS